MITKKIKLDTGISQTSYSAPVQADKGLAQISFNKAFSTVLLVLTFFLPWVFTTYTNEFYETSKNSLLLIAVAILMVLVAVKVLRRKRVSLSKSPFDAFILIFLISQVLSLIFSISKETSLWGFNSRLSGGLFSTIGLLAFYYLIINNASERLVKHLLKVFTVSIVLLALFTILKSFNVFNGLFAELAKVHPSLEFLKSPYFTPIGNSNSLVYLFILVLPLSLYYIFNGLTKYQIFGTVSACLLLLGISITTSSNGIDIYNISIWSMVVGIIVFFLIKQGKLLKGNSSFFIVPVIALVIIGFIFSIDSTLRGKFDLNFSRYYEIPFNTSWSVITGTYNEYKVGGFLVGTGPDTYAYNFPRFRPVEQNNQPNWFENYTRSSSQLEGILVNTGIIGLLAVIVLAGAIVYFIMRNVFGKNAQMNQPVNFTLSLMLIIYFIGFFLLYIPIVIHFAFWLFLGLLVKNYHSSSPDKREEIELKLHMFKNNSKAGLNIAPHILGAAMLIFALVVVFFLGKNFAGEVNYKQSLIASNLGDLASANTFAARALQINDQRDYYHRQMATVGLLYLKQVYAETPAKGSDAEKTKVNNVNYLVNVISQELNTAIALNPSNFENLQLATLIYKQFVDLSQGKSFGDQTLQAVTAAIKLNPNNPDNYLLLGYLYQYNDNKEVAKQAEQYYIRAYNLQPSYPISIFTLGNYLESIQKYNDAMTVYDNSIKLFYTQEGTQINTLLKQKIDGLKGKVEGASTTTNDTQTTDQSPVPTSVEPSRKVTPTVRRGK